MIYKNTKPDMFVRFTGASREIKGRGIYREVEYMQYSPYTRGYMLQKGFCNNAMIEWLIKNPWPKES